MSDRDQNPVYGGEVHSLYFMMNFSCSITQACFLSCVLLLQTVKGMLDNPNEPVSDLSYFDCIESVMENSKVRLCMLFTLLFSIGKNLDVLCVHLPFCIAAYIIKPCCGSLCSGAVQT